MTPTEIRSLAALLVDGLLRVAATPEQFERAAIKVTQQEFDDLVGDLQQEAALYGSTLITEALSVSLMGIRILVAA